MKRVLWWLRVFLPAYPFLFLEIDRITKYRAVVAGEYTLSPHFLSLAIPIEILIGIEIVLVGMFAIFYCASWMSFKTRFSFRKYLFEDFSVHILILGSVLSNTYDLIRRGGVIDWIDLGIVKTNFADIGIIVGICIFAGRYWISKRVAF